MEDDYNFDAPKYVDFLNLQEDNDSFTDEWFDQRAEDEFFYDGSHQASAKDTVFPSSTSQSKPSRVRADGSSRPTCPSPKKSQKLSIESSSQVDPTSPSQNTRSRSQLSESDGTSSKKKALRQLKGTAPGPSRKLGSVQRVAASSTPNLSLKSSEELELEKIKAMRADVEKARRVAQDSYKMAFGSGAHSIPIRSGKPVTMPKGFHFSTDSRLKKKSNAAETDQKVKEFSATLRDSKTVSKAPAKHSTRPQPFKLSHSHTVSSVTKFESDAEKIANFSKRTPQRFRSVAKNMNLPGDRLRSGSREDMARSSSQTRQSPRLTVPKSPALAAKGRMRPVHALSREEQEQLEFEKHKKVQFKAHPVNHRVLEVPQLGVPQATARPLTVPQEFALSRRRSMSTGDLKAALDEVEDHHRFQARPVNQRILQGPMGVKPVKALTPTVPESPAFALKNRVRMPRVVAKEEESHHVPRTKCVPYAGIPFKPKVEHRSTIPEPFQVERHSKEMMTRKQHKIQQILEQERKAREFHASKLPCLDPDELPPKQAKPATKPEPFDLIVDKRGREYQEHLLSKQMEEEARMLKEASNFKAGPNNAILKKPFEPKISTKPLTEIGEFQLNTDIRAASREQYEQHLKQREAEIEALKRQREERQEREERAAVARQRKEAVHRATGIKKYKPAVIKPSDLPLTQAQTPKFSDRLRYRRGSQ